MTYTTRPSIKPARTRRTYAWLLALAAGPGLIAVSCSDDADPDPAGGAGTGGSSASDAGSGGSAAGTGGSAGIGGSASSAAGSSGEAGSAGSTGMPSAGSGGSAGSGSTSTEFTLTSPAFDGEEGCGPDANDNGPEDDADLCDLFPDETTDFAGDNISPQLDWTGAPAGTQSFAIALHDLSFTQGGDPFTHWVMWNIPATADGLAAALPAGTTPDAPAPEGSEQVSIGDNDGFFGSGAAGNVYEFVLYALSTDSIDPGTTDPDAVEQFIEELDDQILDTATLRARSTPED